MTMEQFTENPAILVTLGTALLALIGVISMRAQLLRMTRLRRVLEKLGDGDEVSIQTSLEKIERELDNQANRLSSLANLQRLMEQRAHGFVQRVAVVRYNAFDNMGADLSFSLALLDEDNNGLVMTSLYGRDDSRVYTKPIRNGESTYMLTDEEKTAIKEAGEQREVHHSSKKETNRS